MAILRRFFIPWATDGSATSPGATIHLWPFTTHQAGTSLDRGPFMPFACTLIDLQVWGGFGTPASDGQLPELANGFRQSVTDTFHVWKNNVSVLSLEVTKSHEGETEVYNPGQPTEFTIVRPDQRQYARVAADISFARGDEVNVVVVTEAVPNDWVTEPAFYTVNTLWHVLI